MATHGNDMQTARACSCPLRVACLSSVMLAGQKVQLLCAHKFLEAQCVSTHPDRSDRWRVVCPFIFQTVLKLLSRAGDRPEGVTVPTRGATGLLVPTQARARWKSPVSPVSASPPGSLCPRPRYLCALLPRAGTTPRSTISAISQPVRGTAGLI